MASYLDLLDDLIELQTHEDSDEICHDAAEATAFDLAMDGDASGLRLWLQSNPKLSVNARDPGSGRGILHHACAEGHKEVVKMLLDDADVNLMLRTMLGGLTPLHLAVTNNHRSIVFQLLSNGADALARDKFGCSPMHYVKSISVAKLLVQYGGRVLDCNSKRKNALDSAYQREATEDDDGDPNRDEATRKDLHIYLNEIAQVEYSAKLAKLRELKQQTKAKHMKQQRRKRKSLNDFH